MILTNLISQSIFLATALFLGTFLGLLSGLPLHLIFKEFSATQNGRFWFVAVSLLSSLKIIFLAAIFYYVLHHTALNFILVLVAFLCVTSLRIKKVVMYGRS